MADTKVVSIERLKHYDEKIKAYKPVTGATGHIGLVQPDVTTISMNTNGIISVVDPIPTHTAADAGKALTVNATGAVEWGEGGKTYTAGNGLTLTDTQFKITPGTSGQYMVTQSDGTVGWVTGGASPTNNVLTIQAGGTSLSPTFIANGSDATINIPTASTTASGVVKSSDTYNSAVHTQKVVVNPTDGKMYTEPGGADYTAGDGIDITTDNKIKIKPGTVAGSFLATTTTGTVEWKELSVDPAVKNVLTLQAGGANVGTFTANGDNVTLNIPAASTSAYGVVKVDSALSTTSTNPVENKAVQAQFTTDEALIAANTAAIATKQDKLTAGTNITISGTTISATDTTYTAGDGLTLSGTTFKITPGTAGQYLAMNDSGSAVTWKTLSVDPAVKNTLTLVQGSTTKGTFIANGSDTTITLDAANNAALSLKIGSNGTATQIFTADASSASTATIPTMSTSVIGVGKTSATYNSTVHKNKIAIDSNEQLYAEADSITFNASGSYDGSGFTYVDLTDGTIGDIITNYNNGKAVYIHAIGGDYNQTFRVVGCSQVTSGGQYQISTEYIKSADTGNEFITYCLIGNHVEASGTRLTSSKLETGGSLRVFNAKGEEGPSGIRNISFLSGVKIQDVCQAFNDGNVVYIHLTDDSGNNYGDFPVVYTNGTTSLRTLPAYSSGSSGFMLTGSGSTSSSLSIINMASVALYRHHITAKSYNDGGKVYTKFDGDIIDSNPNTYYKSDLYGREIFGSGAAYDYAKSPSYYPVFGMQIQSSTTGFHRAVTDTSSGDVVYDLLFVMTSNVTLTDTVTQIL